MILRVIAITYQYPVTSWNTQEKLVNSHKDHNFVNGKSSLWDPHTPRI